MNVEGVGGLYPSILSQMFSGNGNLCSSVFARGGSFE